MRNGILKSLLFYAIGFGLTAIFTFAIEQHAHAVFGPNLFVLVLTIVIGLIWALITLVKFVDNKTDNLKGILLGHCFVVVFIILFIVLYQIFEH